MGNQNHLLKRIKYLDGNHSEIFSTQNAQNDNFIASKHHVKNHNTRKSFAIDTRNKLQSLEIEIARQSNNKELNIAQDTTNDPRIDHTMTTEKCNKKYYQAQILPTTILFHLMQTIASVMLEDLQKRMLKQHRNNLSKLQKTINFSRFHC